MYHYFDLPPYVVTKFGIYDWKQHPNPIVVLRNPLDRVLSAQKFVNSSHIDNSESCDLVFANHSAPYMDSILTGVNLRIIDFYALEEYIPRRKERVQSARTDSRVDDTMKAEDVYAENKVYTLQDLEREMEIYQDYMATKERVSVEEWKGLNMDITVTGLIGRRADKQKLIDPAVDTMPIYYEYFTTYGISVLLDRYEWSRGLGLSDKNVKKAQAARHREVDEGLATTEEA
jgi:hypothetical protein